jgi:hypothetical protein
VVSGQQMFKSNESVRSCVLVMTQVLPGQGAIFEFASVCQSDDRSSMMRAMLEIALEPAYAAFVCVVIVPV